MTEGGMKAVVVNCSRPHYNLGARKLADWLAGEGWAVDYWDGDPGLFGLDAGLLCLSVIFSWHAPIAREIALRTKDRAEVWCGGPGMFALGNWWRKETGLDRTKGLDWRFERQRGDYRMTFASRGCPVGCWFCIVPRIEGTTFTRDADFVPAPILCDNNLSALPVEFQEHIIRRYRETGTPLLDANSGCEPVVAPGYYGDTGGASRFFYTAKASRAERNAGLEGLPRRKSADDGYGTIQRPTLDRAAPCENWEPHRTANHHPTVKPRAVCTWLVRLVTPAGGVVLDLFMGSGSIGCAAVPLGYRYIGIEREAEYLPIATARIRHWAGRGRQAALPGWSGAAAGG